MFAALSARSRFAPFEPWRLLVYVPTPPTQLLIDAAQLAARARYASSRLQR
jgi:hypothetical protein